MIGAVLWWAGLAVVCPWSCIVTVITNLVVAAYLVLYRPKR